MIEGCGIILAGYVLSCCFRFNLTDLHSQMMSLANDG